MSIGDPLWAAAESGHLVLPRCGTCEAKFFPPVPTCPHCRSTWSWERSSGHGVVYSQTTCHRPHVAGIEAPYVLAIVELDDGWTLLTNLVGDGRFKARAGDRVRVDFASRPDGLITRTVPVFTLQTPVRGEP